MRPIHEYFQNFEVLVNNVFPIILIVFALINVGALVFLYFKYRDEMFDNFGKALWVNIIGLIIIFSICAVIFSCVVFFSEQDYNLFGNYYSGYAMQNWLLITVGVISIIIGLGVGGYVLGNYGWILAVIAGLIAGGLAYAVLLYIVGFVIYLIIWIVWLILRLIWLIIGSFGLSIYQFVITHWLTCILTIAIPAGLIGLYTAGKGLYESLSFSPEESGYPKYKR